MILFDFVDPSAASAWQAIDDRVMGGVSTSRLGAADGHAVFKGTVSGRDDGGFASVRPPIEPPAPDADSGRDGWQHLQLRVRDDPLTCFVNLRTNATRDGVSYRCDFAITPD